MSDETKPPEGPQPPIEPPKPEAQIVNLTIVREKHVNQTKTAHEQRAAEPMSLDQLRAKDMQFAQALIELGKLTEEEMNIKMRKMGAHQAVLRLRAEQSKALEVAAARVGIPTAPNQDWLLDFVSGVWNRTR